LHDHAPPRCLALDPGGLAGLGAEHHGLSLPGAAGRIHGCRGIEGAPITVVAPPKPRPAQGAAPRGDGAEGRVDAKEQRARDSDARKILEAELRKEELALAVLQKDFNNGEPERRGEERNFARYQERVEEMRGAIARKQSDIAALRRELSKLPPPRPE
jgi:hypothetical protein